MNRTILPSFTFLCLISTVFVMGFPLNIRTVKASGTIYIRADGSVEGTTDITTADNVTYTLNATINDSIVVERSNIVIDGAGYTVNGFGTGLGFNLTNINNVTIKNTQIKQFNHGIYLLGSSNNTVSGNNITNNHYGVCLRDSFNNTVSGNVFVGDGLHVWDSCGSVVVDNLVNGKPLVYLEDVSDMVVEDAGQVILVNCNRIKVENLNLSHTSVGVELWRTNSTTLTGNNITNNYLSGVNLRDSFNNTVSGNNITNNYLSGVNLRDSFNNTVSGNDITNNHYGVYLLDSFNNTVSGNNINNNFGVYLGYSFNNTVSGNDITNNDFGVHLRDSFNNTVSGNDITNNHFGVLLGYSSNNRFYHNNLINNTKQVYVETSGHANFWDNGLEGNYWSDYVRFDLDRNGIGDSAYEIDADNIDNYPMMGIFSDFSATSEYHVQTICNSALSDFQFNGTAICFNVTGENDTIGFCRIRIPRALMNETYKVFVNGTEVLCNLLPCSNTTHSYLYFSYNHSTQEVVIIPEFPSSLVLPLFMILTLLAVIVYKRKLVEIVQTT